MADEKEWIPSAWLPCCRKQGGAIRLSHPVWQGCSGLLQNVLFCSARKRGDADECCRLLSFPPLSTTVRRMPVGIVLMKLWPFDHHVASDITDVSTLCIYHLFILGKDVTDSITKTVLT